ncbi:hypothetical protein PQR63_20745 [Herbaspirillum rhizosphaerae]|uniref:Uncharacterized protein n=1 Tax=Herbaspirillum rhizosphaerae TaxID=346179 RepID=A0ABW8ZCF4_9BURK
MYGEFSQSDADEITTEHAHRTLGHRIADGHKKERDEAIGNAEYWREEYRVAAHALSELLQRQHKTDKDDIVTALAGISTSMNVIAKKESP